MTERQTIIKIDPKDTQPTTNIDRPLNQPEPKPTFGAVIGGVFMSPVPQTPEYQAMKKEAAAKIRQGRS